MPITPELLDASRIASPDYTDEVTAGAGAPRARPAEWWIRAVFEGAPAPLRWALRLGWRTVLGLRLTRGRAPDHVLGWRIASNEADLVVLAAASRLMDCRLVLRVGSDRLELATVLAYRRPAARLLWGVVGIAHRLLTPYLLRRPTRERARKHRAITLLQRHVLNPLSSRLPGQTLLETTGRTSGLPRRTPVGGRRSEGAFWLVSEHGLRSQYVRNIQASPQVRLRLHGRWHDGVAHLLPSDDPRARLATLPRFNSAAVAAAGTDLLTIRVDLSA